MHSRNPFLGILLFLMGCEAHAPVEPVESTETSSTEVDDAVSRGEYLVTITACGDCHTPFKMGPQGPEPDNTRMLSGHPEGATMARAPELPEPWLWLGAATNTAFAGPWGVTYAINLTPEEVTGIGIWTEEMFANAMRTGKHMGTSRTIMPPMPWPSYSKMTDEDLKAVYAYLRSIPPLRNQSPDYEPPAAPTQ
ncbi:MAG: c-type cytochrome [Vicinamibacteria bacterium]